MPHDHHRCECDHARVKYCKPCNVTHCLDCKAEWVAPCLLNHTYPWTYISTTTSPNYKFTGASGGAFDTRGATLTAYNSTGHNH